MRHRDDLEVITDGDTRNAQSTTGEFRQGADMSFFAFRQCALNRIASRFAQIVAKRYEYRRNLTKPGHRM